MPSAEPPICNKVPFIASLKSGTDLLDEYMAILITLVFLGKFKAACDLLIMVYTTRTGDLGSKTGGCTAVSVIYVCD